MSVSLPSLGELVRLAYGDVQVPPLSVSLPDFLTAPLLIWSDVEACLDAIGVVGEFDPSVVARELKPIFPELMELRVGRAEDVLIVAHLPYWTSQTIASGDSDHVGSRLTPEEHEALAQRIGGAFEQAGGGHGSVSDDLLGGEHATTEVSGHWRLRPDEWAARSQPMSASFRIGRLSALRQSGNRVTLIIDGQPFEARWPRLRTVMNDEGIKLGDEIEFIVDEAGRLVSIGRFDPD